MTLPRAAAAPPAEGTPAQAAANAEPATQSAFMRAVVHDRYGPPSVLRIQRVPRPEPADDEVLVRVRATTVTRSDCGFRSAHPFVVRCFTGLRRPRRKILGVELAGEVVAVGSAVTEFAPGDRVFGSRPFGPHAEYVCVHERGALAHMPAGSSFEEAAAACDGAALALACLRQVDLRPGRRLLIYGTGGAVGTAAVQLARLSGAHVTAVCSTRHLALARSLGADAVIDYTQEDFTRNGQTYHAILDAYGQYSPLRCWRSLAPGGAFLATDGGFLWHSALLALLTRWSRNKKVKFGITRYTKEDVLYLRSLMEARRYRPVVDRCYPLEDIVEATRYVETGRKTGNVVLTVGPTPGPTSGLTPAWTPGAGA